MRPLNGQDILQVWERGQTEVPLHQALTLLALAAPESGRDELAALPLGARDGLLLSLRELTFGDSLALFAECPRCGERLEASFSTADLKTQAHDAHDPAPGHELETGEWQLRFRLPTSADLTAVADCPDVDTAALVLARRCVLAASRGGQPLDPDRVPADVLAHLEPSMAKADPQAEVLLNLTCPSCEHGWQVLFDIAAFFWTELMAQARRLLLEVHTLAQSYGWREADILAMSGRRRRAYLELLS